MCGRYQRRSDKQRIAEAFHLGNLDDLFLELAPTYNAAPQSMQPVIVWDEAMGSRGVQMMFWRFLPPFVTDPKKLSLDTINARAEGILTSKIWRSAFLSCRCLIPVDSFIEWRRVDKKTKLPWVFTMKDDEPFALGGVWRHWRAPDGTAEMNTFAIVTTDPNELLVETTGHDRMPVIIKRSDYKRWLDPGNQEHPPVDLLRPFDSNKMRAVRVNQRINNVRNNDPSLCDPVEDDAGIPPKEEPKNGRRKKDNGNGQLGMFGD
jgi:putative SOS response-associated peptidase YedK